MKFLDLKIYKLRQIRKRLAKVLNDIEKGLCLPDQDNVV